MSPSENSQNRPEETAAAAAELQRFLDENRGRSPAEVLGPAAESHLLQGILLATAGAFFLLAVFTVGPWLLVGTMPREIIAEQEQAPASPTGDEPQPEEAEPTTDPDVASTPAVEQGDDKLGMSEVLDPAAAANPLDQRFDDLLGELEPE